MQTVDTRGIDRLVESWDRLLKQFPEAKRRALEQMGRDLLANVRKEIGGSGKVAGWQAAAMWPSVPKPKPTKLPKAGNGTLWAISPTPLKAATSTAAAGEAARRVTGTVPATKPQQCPVSGSIRPSVKMWQT